MFGAFTLAYALFEIPAGWLGDRFGPRKVLLRVVLWWSFFTAATAQAGTALAMMVVRFLFGAGEAGCFPNITKAFSTWLPPDERVRAQGMLWLAARWGGAVTPLLVVAVLGLVSSWRRAFELFGVLGLVWAFFFYRWFRDNPHEHPSVNDAEKRLLTGVEQSRLPARQCSLGGLLPLVLGVAVVDPVRVLELRLVLLRHLVPDVSRTDARQRRWAR